MNKIWKIATFALLLGLAATMAMAQEEAPAAALANLADGAGSITGTTGSWGNYTAFALIPGSALLGVKATTTSLYLGFTSGSMADVGAMVLYKTNRSSNVVISKKKVLLGGVANPSINLASTAVCPVQPVSLSNPCIVKLDAIKGALSSLSDYTFAIYFLNDSNNTSVTSAGPSSAQGSLTGWYASGNQTNLAAKKPLPGSNGGGAPYFLLYVDNQ
jgi:hypothetical protein